MPLKSDQIKSIINLTAISLIILGGCKSDPKTETEAADAKAETRAMAAETLAKAERLPAHGLSVSIRRGEG